MHSLHKLCAISHDWRFHDLVWPKESKSKNLGPIWGLLYEYDLYRRVIITYYNLDPEFVTTTGFWVSRFLAMGFGC